MEQIRADSYFLVNVIGDNGCASSMGINRVYQLNNSVTFSEKPVGSEEFLNQMVESLGIIKDRRPKGRPRKMES